MFNKPHDIFKELPVGNALNWPYQALIHTGVERIGLVMEGEELLVGAYHTYPMAIGTAMGIVPMGKGSVCSLHWISMGTSLMIRLPDL